MQSRQARQVNSVEFNIHHLTLFHAAGLRCQVNPSALPPGLITIRPGDRELHRLDVLRPVFLYLLDKEFATLCKCMYSFGSFFFLTPEITCQSDAAPGPICI